MMNWRIATTEAGLTRSPMSKLVGIPLQIEPEDYSTEQEQSEGGTSYHGYKKYKILWKDLDEIQASTLRRLVAEARAGSRWLYITGRWYDEANSFTRWVDMRGKPKLEKMAPAPPELRMGMAIYSNVVLQLNNIDIVNDPALF